MVSLLISNYFLTLKTAVPYSQLLEDGIIVLSSVSSNSDRQTSPATRKLLSDFPPSLHHSVQLNWVLRFHLQSHFVEVGETSEKHWATYTENPENVVRCQPLT